MRSPALSSMSTSRVGLHRAHVVGQADQVVGRLAHGADHHHDLVAGRRVRATWSATARIRSASPTEVPPNFCTTRDTVSEGYWGTVRGPAEPGDRRRATGDGDRESDRLPCAPVPTDKRQRQKAGRQARLAAEQKIAQAPPGLRRMVTVAIVAAVVVGISDRHLQAGQEDRPAPRRPPRPATTTTKPVPRAARAIPAWRLSPRRPTARPTVTATLNKPSWPVTAGHDHRPLQDLHGHRDHRRRALHHQPRPKPGAQDGQQLRLPGRPPLLRLHRLPPGHPRLRRPDRRPDRHRHRRPGLPVRRRAPGEGRPPVPAGLGGHGQLRAPTPTAASSSSWPAPRARRLAPATRCSARSPRG